MALLNSNRSNVTDGGAQRAPGSPITGQLWALTEGGGGGGADTRLFSINSDGTGQATLFTNINGDKFSTQYVEDLAVDTATGFYFAIVASGLDDSAQLVRGQIGSSAAPTVVFDYADKFIVHAVEVDAITRKVYVGHFDGSWPTFDSANSGIKVYSYDAAGVMHDDGFLTTMDRDDRTSTVLNPRDFALDSGGQRLFYTERLDAETTGLYRIDLGIDPDHATRLAFGSGAGQFGEPGTADFKGFIGDVDVDETTGLLYFTTSSRSPSPDGNYVPGQNALWVISQSASASTAATKVTLSNMPGGNLFYPGDMTFDPVSRQFYIESEEASGNETDDVIYVFQLDVAGTAASWVRTITPNLTHAGADIEGLTFVSMAELTVNGTSSAALEQGSAVTLLSGQPPIVDYDGGYLVGATVQITSGGVSGADHLGIGGQPSGSVGGITYSWNAGTLTLSGYDTIANYQAALAQVGYWATGDNPTNYGANTTRTITWTVDDGTDAPAGAVNSGTTTLTVTADNDAPVNTAPSAISGAEDGGAIAVNGLRVTDVDTNPASQNMTVVLSVAHGVLSLKDNVSNGLVSGDIVSSNGGATLTVTGTQNEINATLAASSGLTYTAAANYNGADTLTVQTSDGGKSDSDPYGITITAVNDAPTVTGDGAEVLLAGTEDVSPSSGSTISSLFEGQFGDSADGGSANVFAGVAVVTNGSSAAGEWQYLKNGDWVAIGAGSPTSAVLLNAGTQIRFDPAEDYAGAAPTLGVRLIDSSGAAFADGATDNIGAGGGSSRYSATPVTLDQTINGVNDAPVLTGGVNASLTSVGEDSGASVGDSITSLFSGRFSDTKDGGSAAALAGVAVIANAATDEGTYEYFNGSIWQPLPSVSVGGAFLLSPTAEVRFVPAANYSGTAPGLTVSLIEGSAVTTGQTADLTTTGGSTHYSTPFTLDIQVTPTNDAPTASGSATLGEVNEDTAQPAGASVFSLFDGSFDDPDVGNVLGGVAIIHNGATAAEGEWQYKAGGTWIKIDAPTTSSALFLAADALLRFVPTANYNGIPPTLEAHLVDSSTVLTSGQTPNLTVTGDPTAYSDDTVILSTSVAPVNDAPTVPATTSDVNADEQTAATLLGALTVGDLELDARNGGLGDYGGATFSVQRASANPDDSFAFDTSGAMFSVNGGDLRVSSQTVATFTSTGGVLTIHFDNSAPVSKALANDIIQHITYTNGSDAPPASVSLAYALDDGGVSQGGGGAKSSAGVVVVHIAGDNDLPDGGAAITGLPAEDQTLTAVSTLTDPDGLGGLHYQWQRDLDGKGFVDVGGDSATYDLSDADIGGVFQVKISYTDGGGTKEVATSDPTTVVTASNDEPTGAVTFTGARTEDATLTADVTGIVDDDGLSGVTYHYQWQRSDGKSGYEDVGGDATTYELGDADVGKAIRLTVTYEDEQGFDNSISSADSAPIAGVNDPHTGTVAINGPATEGTVLTVTSTLDDEDGLGTLSYQWQRDDGKGGAFANIGGATGATYTLDDADVGAKVQVKVSYTDQQNFPEEAFSAPTAAVEASNDEPTGAVTFTGARTEDATLTVDTSGIVDDDGLSGVTYHYQWQRSDGEGGYENVGGDATTYKLGDEDVGKTIHVTVTYEDEQGFDNSIDSADSAPIAGVDDPHTGTVAINGPATEGTVLSVTSTLADDDGLGTLTYVWQRDADGKGFVDIGGATASTYTLDDADVGAKVQVVVTYIDKQGFTETETSAPTGTVDAVDDEPTGAVTFTGTAAEDETLTVDLSDLDDADGLSGVTYHYQWQRSDGKGGYENVGNDATTYDLGDADVGKKIRVTVSYEDQQGFDNSVDSADSDTVTGVNDPHSGDVTLSGTATEDQVLTAVSTLDDDDGLGTLSYDWQRDDGKGGGFASISGAANQSTYTLGDADVGAMVRAVVSFTDKQGFLETETSDVTATVANINDAPTGSVTIGGSARPGQTLTAGNSLVDADGLGTITYQWKADGADIVGATAATLELTGKDVGKAISVVASYTDLHGTAESVSSTSVNINSNQPPPSTTTTVIDGAPVEVTKTTNPDGSVTQTTTISSVTPSATEQTADIPLFTEGGQSLLSVSAPIGFSMTISGNDRPEPASSVLDNLVTAIRGAGGDTSQTGAGGDFLSTLTDDSRVLVQTVTPTLAPNGATNIPLTFEGSPPTNGVFTALVLDVSNLPPGTIINLNNIDFVTIIGASQVGGGEGSQVVFGDSDNQYIVLGADDDVLHGGGGDDTVGSKGGNDKIYGDAGDDTLFGGEGNDIMDGGAGADTVLMGGNLKDYVFSHNGLGLLATSFEGDDTIVNVETLKMTDGSTVTDLNPLVAGTTSVAVMTYQFFTGKTPTAAGLEYLLHAPDAVNASDLSDPYYLQLNVDNRYINFAVNLASPQGQAHAWFETNYGALNFEQTLTKAYKEIFGVTLTDDRIQHLLYDQVGNNMTRLDFFETFAGSEEGAKAGIIGWLLAAAVLENTGRYAAANTAFLNDFADGDAKLNVDLVGVYGDGHAWGAA